MYEGVKVPSYELALELSSVHDWRGKGSVISVHAPRATTVCSVHVYREGGSVARRARTVISVHVWRSDGSVKTRARTMCSVHV